MSHSIVLVEDRDEIRESLAHLIQLSPGYFVSGSYRSGEEALEALETDRPRLVLMDLDLPGIDGIETTRRIKARRPQTDILVHTVFEDSDRVFRALCAGATGYLTKSAGPERLLSALREALDGGAPMSARIARLVVRSFQKSHESPLTERETEVLQALSHGRTIGSIAEVLCVGRETVRTHVKNIYLKLQVNSREDALRIAREQRLI